ncbi:MAG: hypothetical protein K0R69_1469 [Clostridia bacterium]|jgi:hypothetical protein|nr:hypothetical protein [Clostridia bacterium]
MTLGNPILREMKMDISFNGGRFISLKNGLNYQEVLNNFSNESKNNIEVMLRILIQTKMMNIMTVWSVLFNYVIP